MRSTGPPSPMAGPPGRERRALVERAHEPSPSIQIAHQTKRTGVANRRARGVRDARRPDGPGLGSAPKSPSTAPPHGIVTASAAGGGVLRRLRRLARPHDDLVDDRPERVDEPGIITD